MHGIIIEILLTESMKLPGYYYKIKNLYGAFASNMENVSCYNVKL